jgi:hypothetical protein
MFRLFQLSLNKILLSTDYGALNSNMTAVLWLYTQYISQKKYLEMP